MRIQLASVAALAIVGAGLGAVPSSAAGSLARVGTVLVSPSNDNDGTPTVDVSWSGAPADADGVLVCLHRGTSAISTPDDCESQIAVEAPGTSSGPITFHPAKNYVVELFSYQTTSPITYSAPVSKVRHGVKIRMTSRCGSQTVGSTCKLTATATDVTTGARLANRKVQLWTSREKQPAKWARLGTRTTNHDGVASMKVTLDKNRLYEWYYGSPRTRELSSSSSRVDIAVGR
jgi:hypothetical protein